jgi:hypothetical protein
MEAEMESAAKLGTVGDKTRGIVELILVGLGINYLLLLITMYAICPLTSQSFVICAVTVSASLAAVACMLLFIAGMVFGSGALIHDYRAGKDLSNVLPGKGF